MCRIRPGQLFGRYYRSIVSSIHDYYCRFGPYFDISRTNFESRHVRVIAQTGFRKKKNKLFRYINLWLARGNRLYEKLIRKGLKHARRVVAAFGISLIAIWVLNEIVPQSFMPQEDQGYFTVELELPEGATLERTRHVTERAMNYLMSREDVEYVLNVTGSSPRVGTNQSRSQLTVILKPWEDRKSSNLRDIMEDIREELKNTPKVKFI